jgi:regulator of protease activity HflC (stomatin/prohibitin superfamily)
LLRPASPSQLAPAEPPGEAIARVEDITVSEAVRQAINEHVQAKRSDRAFQERLDRFMNENQAILERLAR